MERNRRSEVAPYHTPNEHPRFCVLQTFLDNVGCRNGENSLSGVEEKRRASLRHFAAVRIAQGPKKGAAYDAAILISASPRPATISAIAFCFSTSLGSMHRESCSGNMRGKLRRQGRASSLTAYTLEIDRGISPKASPDCS